MQSAEQGVERYRSLREWFDQLIDFSEAAWQELPPDSPLLTQYDYDNWMAQLRAYQHVCCQRCGAFLSPDALGLGAYALEPSARICGACYDELTEAQPGIRRRLARLAAYAQEQPQLCAGLLVAAQERLQLDDWALERHLGLNGVGVLRLALAPLPEVHRQVEAIDRIAREIGCDLDVLRRLLLPQQAGSPTEHP